MENVMSICYWLLQVYQEREGDWKGFLILVILYVFIFDQIFFMD